MTANNDQWQNQVYSITWHQWTAQHCLMPNWRPHCTQSWTPSVINGQWSSVDAESTWPRLLSSLGVINNRLMNVAFYAALGNTGHAVAKLPYILAYKSLSRISRPPPTYWSRFGRKFCDLYASIYGTSLELGQSSRGKYPCFWRHSNVPKRQCRICWGKRVCKKAARSVQPIRYNIDVWQTHTTTAYIMLV